MSTEIQVAVSLIKAAQSRLNAMLRENLDIVKVLKSVEDLPLDLRSLYAKL